MTLSKSLAGNTSSIEDRFSGLGANEIRQQIIAHGRSKETDVGPEYVACHCHCCEYGRDRLVEVRMRALLGKNPAGEIT